ncbi:MAG: peptidoglycan bridge formation glycyltransferase FemA/FemB family protein [Candidatus Saccharibacteria bacterium]|nr:peptidoglycan bridge formation glycyltransferase FemA/FemB family protein [Candidatus Saccharibacteria bacterium]
MHPHFLQSAAWQAFQEARGRTVYYRTGDGWSYRAILEPGTTLSPTRLYCPYGPTATSPHALETALASLVALAQSCNATFVRVEPLGTQFSPTTLQLRKVQYSQPAHTWQIDLTQSQDDIIAAMKQNNRSIYRNYHKKGLSYRHSTNPTECHHLLDLLHEVAAHNNITVHSDNYLQAQANTLLPAGHGRLHFIEYEGRVIAAALTYESDTTCYYAHAGASHEYRKLAASTALLAEIIIDAKQRGKTICDLYGITTSSDPQHRWAGFTRFKKSFGGYKVTLSDTYDLPVKPLAYRLYSLAKKLRSLPRALRTRLAR